MTARCRCCCRSAQGSGATRPASKRAATRTGLKAADLDRSLLWRTVHCSAGTPGPRPLLPGAVCVRKSVTLKRPGKKHHGQGGVRKLSQMFQIVCDNICSLKCIHLRKRALSSSLSQFNTARPASEQYGAAAHTGHSRAALAGDSND